MAWDDSAPTEKELGTAQAAWDELPPDTQAQATPSAADAAVKGFGNGVTLGWLPNIEGGAQSALDLLKGNSNVLQNYRQHRDENYKDIDAAKQAHPAAFLGGNLAGGAATALVPGLGEANLGKLALLGGAAGLGGSRADLTTGDPSQLAQGATDAAKGAGTGLVLGAAARGLGGALNKLSAGRTAAAESGAADAVGASPYTQASNNVGKTVLDQNVLQQGNLTGTLGKAQAAIENLKNDRDLYLSSLNDKLSKLNPHDVSQKVGTASDKAMNLLDDLTNDASKYSNDTGGGVISNIAPPMQDYVNKLNEAGNNLESLNDIKSSIQSEVDKLTQGGAYNNFNPNPGLMDKANALKQLGGVVKQHIQDLADVAEQGAGQTLANKNQQIGNLSDAIKGINGKLSVGPDDSGLAGTAINTAKAAATGFSPYSTATAAKSIVKNLSPSPATNQSLAGYASKAADVAKNYGSSVARTGSLYSASDDELHDLASRLQQENGTQHIGQALATAVQNNDPAAKNRAIFLIKQTSGARDIANQMNNE